MVCGYSKKPFAVSLICSYQLKAKGDHKLDNDLRIILGDYESFVQSHTIEINKKEVIYYITLKKTFISCPECGSRMNIKDYRKCKVIHNMIRGKNTSLILKKRRSYKKKNKYNI